MKVISVPLILLVAVAISKCHAELYQKEFNQALDLLSHCPVGSPESADVQAAAYALLSSNKARIRQTFCKIMLVNRLKCLQDTADDDTSPDQNAARASIKLWSALCDGATLSCSGRPEFFITMLMLPIVAFMRN